MANASVRKKSILAILGAILACALVVSFSLHTVQLDHVHPGSHTLTETHTEDSSFGVFFSEYLHGSEKKLFIFTLLSFLLAGAFLGLQTRFDALLRSTLLFKRFLQKADLFVVYRVYDFLLSLFRTGILNTKTY